MDIMTSDEFEKRLQGLQVELPRELMIPSDMGRGMERLFAEVTLNALTLGPQLLEKVKEIERDNEALGRHPVELYGIRGESLELVHLGTPVKFSDARNLFNEEVHSLVGYMLLLYAPQVTAKDGATEEELANRLESDEVEGLLESLKKAENAGSAKEALDRLMEGLQESSLSQALEFSWSGFAYTVMPHKLWSMLTVNAKNGIERMVMSNWTGDAPIRLSAMNSGGAAPLDMEALASLFTGDDAEPYPRELWEECVDYVEKDTKKNLLRRETRPAVNYKIDTAALQKELGDDDETLFQLVQRDGHEGYAAAYGVLVNRARNPKKDWCDAPTEELRLVRRMFQAHVEDLTAEIEAREAPEKKAEVK